MLRAVQPVTVCSARLYFQTAAAISTAAASSSGATTESSQLSTVYVLIVV